MCGPRELDPDDAQAVTNPTLIVEVLSRSTEDDRGDKFEHYKHLPSLRQYVLVSHRERALDVWTRSGDDASWSCVTVGDGETATLESVDATLVVTELYDAATEPTS